MNQMSKLDALYSKYNTLVDYADKRQEHHIEKAEIAMKDYQRTGDVSYYQAAENHMNMSTRLSAEVVVYRKIKEELKEVLKHESVK